MPLHEKCSVGLAISDICHLQRYSRSIGLRRMKDLESGHVLLILFRVGMTVGDCDTICYHHEQTMLNQYSQLQKRCCDPFKQHKKVSRSSKAALRNVSMEMAHTFKNK